MFTITTRSFSVFAMLALLLVHAVSAHPVVIGDLYARAPSPAPHRHRHAHDHAHDSQELLAANSSTASGARAHRHTLQDLFNGNKHFRQNVRLEAVKAANDTPSFMLTPSTIFNTPPGSILTHNNIANQYSSQDPSAEAAVAYGIEALHVQHIIVLGHYGCKGVETAITKTKSVSRYVREWVKSISEMYRKSRRQEIVMLRESRMPRRGQDKGITTPPPASDPGFRALVEENVKHSVKELRHHSILAEAYSRRRRIHGHQNHLPTDVFVHGFVYDESTGQVHDLNVSFGPPGKAIPHVPFEALQAAQNYHADSKPNKAWDFSKDRWHKS
ncbi:hypothetical protein CVT26_011388 [Gymnopilus dilepis]|uniref:Carbonic anhydrase n=1 Tax=Gymnopilus dilepis TaxID=231916 RepID=A0A409YHD8_9AGAR|nr:hypothetical protein CVT26_011388 [Gymnopilus dilepis]